MQSFYYFSNLFTILLSLGLSVFILAKGRKLTNRLFFVYSLCVAGWAAAKFLAWLSPSPGDLFWMRGSIAIAIFIPVIYYHFSVIFTERSKAGIKWAYLSALVLLFSCFSKLMVDDLGRTGTIKTILPGPLYFVFWFGFGALIIAGLLNFFRGLATGDIVKKNQLKYLIFASIIGFGGGMLVFLSNIYPHLEPIGYSFIPLYSVIAAFAIVKHHLLDINVVIRSGIIYSIITLLLTGIYFLGFTVFRDIFASYTAQGSVLTNFAVILLFVFLFQPLRARVQEMVDRIFFRQKIDREKAIISFSNRVQGIFELGPLLEFVIFQIKDVLKIRWATIYLKDDRGSFKLKPEHLSLLEKSLDALFLSDVELLLPISLRGELLGVLHVRGKNSEESFSFFEVELLKMFLGQAASSLKNAFLFNEIIEHQRRLYQSSNLANLGTLAAGMAHEIKNPLAVIKGLTQVLPENLHEREFLEKFVRIVPGQIDRINSAIEALLTVGKSPGLEKTRIDINGLLREVVDFVRPSFLKKDIAIALEFSSCAHLMGDYNMLYQVFFNLVQNAGQAMENGGNLTIRTAGENRVEISDTGMGIPEDKIDRIFSPFITTREGGVGLGLFMVKRILDLHEAKIEVESVPGNGAVFRIDFQKG